jgi:hypothetical protein
MHVESTKSDYYQGFQIGLIFKTKKIYTTKILRGPISNFCEQRVLRRHRCLEYHWPAGAAKDVLKRACH